MKRQRVVKIWRDIRLYLKVKQHISSTNVVLPWNKTPMSPPFSPSFFFSAYDQSGSYNWSDLLSLYNSQPQAQRYNIILALELPTLTLKSKENGHHMNLAYSLSFLHTVAWLDHYSFKACFTVWVRGISWWNFHLQWNMALLSVSQQWGEELVSHVLCHFGSKRAKHLTRCCWVLHSCC